MGICSSSCCGGAIDFFAVSGSIKSLIDPGKSRDALYENVLAENEREAVADLLQYLENVCRTHHFTSFPFMLTVLSDLAVARRDRFLRGRTPPSLEHPRLFR